jgi:hypothetical protein
LAVAIRCQPDAPQPKAGILAELRRERSH